MNEIYLVMFSGGISSAECLRLAIEKYGKDNVRAVFADIGQYKDEQGRVIDGECDDLYRFMEDVEFVLDFKIDRIRNPKFMMGGIWEVFRKVKFMGNTLKDPCSAHLKRKILTKYVKEKYPDATIIVGLEHSEKDRQTTFEKFYKKVWFPLNDNPKLKSKIIIEWVHRGVEPPQLYIEGFGHNNCSGFCVKSGVYGFYWLWKKRPWVYAHHEAQELIYRYEFHMNAHISYDYGTLEQMRARFESGWIPIKTNTGCGGSCIVI